ncbi:MAG: hypothetical protein ABIF09_09900 [Gemmatimonadota bacterium]
MKGHATRSYAFLALWVIVAFIGCSPSVGPGESSDAGCQGAIECKGIPFPVPGVPALSQISAGSWHTCGLAADGAAWCWGFNWMGETGSTRLGPTERDPAQVPGGLAFAEISANHGYTCALTLDGALYCWGLNLSGLLGTGTTTGISTTPQQVAGGYSFTLMSAGSTHMCGVTAAGAAYCWGDNTALQLGGR